MTSAWLGVFLSYMQPQFIIFLQKGEIGHELIKQCHLNREGNQRQGSSTQLRLLRQKAPAVGIF